MWAQEERYVVVRIFAHAEADRYLVKKKRLFGGLSSGPKIVAGEKDQLVASGLEFVFRENGSVGTTIRIRDHLSNLGVARTRNKVEHNLEPFGGFSKRGIENMGG